MTLLIDELAPVGRLVVDSPNSRYKKESDMPLATRRMDQASVNGSAPVARATLPVATAAVGSPMTDHSMDEIEAGG
jgi:hypothetical protein